MRQRLVLTIALTAFVAALGGGLAAAEPLVELGGGQIGVNVPGVDIPPVQLPACANGVDDDRDGLADLSDSGCVSSGGTSEVGPPAIVPDPAGSPPAGDPPSDDGEPPAPHGNQTGVDDTEPEAQNQTQLTPGGGGEPVSGGTTGPSGRNHTSAAGDREVIGPPPRYQDDGTPTITNPTTTIALFGPAPIGVPNFVIDQFEIPPFLLPIYQACGTQYDIPWQLLASINKIETAFGTNLNVSTAGAVGWMQFMPATWEAYGVDANGDSRKDPYNPVDAICAAARYLKAAGGSADLYSAIFAYNHADWYVDEVLLYARAYGKLPDDLVSSLTGLTEGAHFPVAADARYADDISEREALARAKPGSALVAGNAADVISGSPTRRGINIFSRKGAPIVAVNDGVIRKIGRSPKLGNYLILVDAYGNRFTYAGLGRVVSVHPVPKPQKLTAEDFQLVTLPDTEAAPTAPASDNAAAANGDSASATLTAKRTRATRSSGPINTEDLRERVYANPERPKIRDRASLAGQIDDLAGQGLPGYTTFKNYFNDVFAFNSRETELRPLEQGSKVVGGTVLATMAGPVDGVAPHMHFVIRPAGRGAPRIDPKPILDGWKLLEATAIYRASNKNPFTEDANVGQVLLMSKEALIRRVLADPRLEIYSCGRTDIRTGIIGRRVLATLEFLAEKGFRMGITSLQCGHSYFSAGGGVSNHSFGDAVDIATINGIPVFGNQGPGTLSEALVKTVLQLQGTMRPTELISLMNFGGPSFALGDHDDHVHVGWDSRYGVNGLDQQFAALLKPDQWERLIDRLGQIEEPEVPVGASDFSIPVGKGGKDRSSDAHIGE